MFTAQVAFIAGPPASVAFESLQLQFAKTNTWSDAVWIFRGEAETVLSTSAVEQIDAAGAMFAVEVREANGDQVAHLHIQCVLTSEPFGSLCFLAFENAVGYLEGVTVAVNRGAVHASRYELDPN